MAANPSFDISTGADLQEVDNAVNQAVKEIAQRYDFKGTHCTIEFDRTKATIKLAADDEFRMKRWSTCCRPSGQARRAGRRTSSSATLEQATGSTVRQTIELTQGIDQETAKKIVKAIKDKGFKKVQASIQGEEIRVSSPSKDELQEVMAFLRAQDFGLELKFGNYRS